MRAIRLPAWLRTAAVLALGIAAYSNTAQIPFLFDDIPSLVRNESIRSLSPAVLTPPVETTVAGRPVANLSFALNYAISGLRLAPLHATNLALHLATALVLMALVRRTLLLPRLRERYGGSADGLSLVAALLWALHPVQTESVTYLVQRVESLAGLFLVTMLYAALRAAEAERPFGWNALAILACGLGMGAKETMAVAPLIALLFDRAFLFGSFREALARRRTLYGGLAACWAVLALLVATNPRPFSAGLQFAGFRPHHYLGIQLGAIVRYLRLLLLPVGLVFDYGEPGSAVPLARSVSQWGPPALFLLALFALSAWAWFRRPPFGFLALGFFILLAPSSSVIPIATEVISEHRLYLPSAAAVLAAVFAAHALVRLPEARAALGAAAVLALALLTWRRNADYRTAVTIWANSAQRWPQNARAWSALGRAWQDEGDIPRARASYEEALRRDPLFLNALVRLASLEEDKADATHDAQALDRAIDLYRRYLARRRSDPDVQLNLAHCLEKRGRIAEALEHYRLACELRPDDAAAAGDRANALAHAGRLDEAAAAYRAMLALAPGWALGHYNYGAFLARAGRLDEARDEFSKALRLDERLAPAWHRAALVAGWTGHGAEAVIDLEKALRLDPGRVEAMLDLAWLLATHPDPQVRDGKRALEWAEKAGALAPRDQARPLDVLAAAQAENGRFDEAAGLAAKAVELAARRGLPTEALQARLALYRKRLPARVQPAP